MTIPMVSPVVNAHCRVPPMRNERPRVLISDELSCSPMTNSSSTTPISAKTSTCWVSGTRARPEGPMSTPLIRKPTTGGMRSRAESSTTATAAARTATASDRNSTVSIRL